MLEYEDNLDCTGSLDPVLCQTIQDTAVYYDTLVHDIYALGFAFFAFVLLFLALSFLLRFLLRFF